MLVIVGKSGSGKTSVAKELEKMGYNRIVTYTTRPIRAGEVNGVDYHFVSTGIFEELIKNNSLLEYQCFNDWLYGTQLPHNIPKQPLLILNPCGLKKLKELNNKLDKPFDIQTFYIKIDENSRFDMLLKTREDQVETKRRFKTDLVDFKGMESIVDHVCCNIEYKYSPKIIADKINAIYMESVNHD